MGVNDLVKSDADSIRETQRMASNPVTDAVNSGIVGSTDKSGLMLRDPKLDSARSAARGFSETSPVRSTGSAAHSSADSAGIVHGTAGGDADRYAGSEPIADRSSSSFAASGTDRFDSPFSTYGSERQEQPSAFAEHGSVNSMARTGSEAQKKANALVHTDSAVKKASSVLKQAGGKVAADRLVTSAAEKKKMLSAENFKKAAKGAVISEALRDSDFEGADEYYYKAKGAWKLGRRGASAVKGAAEKRAAKKAAKEAAKKAGKDVSGGASRATKMLDKKNRKLSPRDMQRRMQSMRNQRKAIAAARQGGQSIAAKLGLGKAGVAARGAIVASGGGAGAALAAIIVPFLICLMLVMSMFMLMTCGGDGGDSDNSTGSLTGTAAEIAATLKQYGFSNEAIAAVLGNFTLESTGDYGNINANTDSDDGFGTTSLGIMQMTGLERVSYLSWCIYNGKQWGDVSSQMEWAFSNESGTSDGYFANRWQMVGPGVSYYDCEPGWQARFRTDWYRNGDSFKNSTDVDLATFSWMACYERCGSGKTKRYPVGVSHLDKRLDFAQRYLADLNSSTDSGGTAPAGANAIVQRAYAELGKPYVWGAVGPSSYDCSGLVSYCLTGGHSRIGNTTTFMGWKRVTDPQPGDVCTNDHHCGIYIGNGKMIHSPQTGDVVKISNVHKGMIYVRYGG